MFDRETAILVVLLAIFILLLVMNFVTILIFLEGAH